MNGVFELMWIPLYTPFTVMSPAPANPPLLGLMAATLLVIVMALLLLWPKLPEVLKWIRG